MEQRELAVKLGKQETLLEQARSKQSKLNERKDSLLEKVREEAEVEELEAHDKELEELEVEVNDSDEEVIDLEKKVKDINKELDEAQVKKEDKDEEADQEVEEGAVKMNEEQILTEETPEVAERAALNTFIRSKGSVRAGLTTVEGAAVIPTDDKTSVKVPAAGEELNLGNLVGHESVTTGAGNYPILEKTKAVMSTVAELELNPILANPTFLEVDYKIETYRGVVPISQEAIDDAAIDLVALVRNHVERMKVNTINAKVGEILKTFTAKTVKTTDDIKALINVDLDPAYNKTFVMSQSFFQLADTVKDANNHYLMQPNVTGATGFTFLGIPVVIAKDTQLGNAKQAKAFLGDLKEAVIYFDRKQISARWVDSDIYGQKLQAGARFDVKKADANAGVFLTATALDVVTPVA